MVELLHGIRGFDSTPEFMVAGQLDAVLQRQFSNPVIQVGRGFDLFVGYGHCLPICIYRHYDEELDSQSFDILERSFDGADISVMSGSNVACAVSLGPEANNLLHSPVLYKLQDFLGEPKILSIVRSRKMNVS